MAEKKTTSKTQKTDVAVPKKAKSKSKKKVIRGRAYIKATFNNTIITLTDEQGNPFIWGSPAILGFKNSKRGTAYVASKAAEDVGFRAKKFGLQEVQVFINGPGAGRNAAVKGLATSGLKILSLSDRTPIRHGGCRPKKPARN